jgi:UDP-glucose 4-epimerase
VKYFSKNINKKIKINISKKRAGDIGQIYADKSKLLNFFPNWKPNRNIRQSVDASVKWERYIKKNRIL